MAVRQGARLGLVAACAALAVVLVPGCSSSPQVNPPAPPPASAPAPNAAPPGPAPAAQGNSTLATALGNAHQGAAALIALGGLGTAKGIGEQVKGLAPELTSQGQAIDQQIRQQAQASGATLNDQLSQEQQATIADLQARSGEPFDQAWLRAASDLMQQARDAANAVLNDPSASPEAKAAAQDTLTKLDALRSRLERASSSAGAATPGSVNAGTGGQAERGAWPRTGAAGLAGLAALLLIGGAWLRRRSAA
ncbi:MAG TPA: DUF4142 domain-containing protein [Pseudonocardia sp.]